MTKTLTIPPSPTVPVEIIKQPSSGWELKDVITLGIALFSLFVSAAAGYWSYRTWKLDGPVFEAEFETSKELGLWMSLRSTGRSGAYVEPFILSGREEYDFCRLPGLWFDLQKGRFVEAGEIISGCFPVEDFAQTMIDEETSLDEINLLSFVAAKPYKIVIPKEHREALRKWVEPEYNQRVKRRQENQE